ncbi:MAG TPA: DUF4236 domain-containing protein [Micromonosporaceae bacterium]|nr:DUF4236 domain-containing protein [Micromonosporaceae bacterium]
MGLQYRKVWRLGPVRLNFTQQGFSSWSIKIGRWSWNSRARASRVDLPGAWSWRGRGRSS